MTRQKQLRGRIAALVAGASIAPLSLTEADAVAGVILSLVREYAELSGDDRAEYDSSETGDRK